jgi:hypothetical protein
MTKVTTHSELVTGTFRDRASAERAYEDLVSRGYTSDEINVLMSEDTRKRHFKSTTTTTEMGSKAASGGLAGATVGGTVGAVAGALAVGATLAIPGLGIVLAGPLAAALAGLGAGAAAGGLIGGLIGAGIPEERAKVYKTEIDNGGIILGVQPRSAEDVAYIRDTWRGKGEVRLPPEY